ncbi:MAG: Gfo/Idh/MocA family oxidoreductase [Boseongicola sp.]|nr:Gfo/Idh/MocA family oxidoreductase [Boseongicola sp.]
MIKPVRWGVLGAAKFAREQMAPAIHMAKNAELAAIATSDPKKAEPFQAFQPRLRVFDDYDALLADDAIDAVYVPLPNHLHVEWTLKALAAGKAVLTEKPIALKEAEFDRLIAARDEAGLLAAEAYMPVHHPQWLKVRDLIAEGVIGELAHVRGIFTYNNADRPENIRNRPETAGGGLRDIGVYPFGTARFATGAEPSAVRAEITWENSVDTIARVHAAFPKFTFEAVVSMRMQLYQEMTFHGDRGILRVGAPFNPLSYGEAEVQLITGSQTHSWRFPMINQYVEQVENFGKAMRGEIAYPAPLEFSRGTQRMIDMTFAAAGAGAGASPIDYA